MKVLAVILGVLVIIAGIFCVIDPAWIAVAGIWILGVALVVMGISNLCTYSEKKKHGQATGWTIFGAIVSIIVGLFIMFSRLFGLLLTNTIITIIIGAWLLVYGVITIVTSIKVHSVAKATPNATFGKRWGWGLTLGILMVVAGLLVLIFPMVSTFTIDILVGVYLGVMLMISGVNTIALAFTE